MAQRLQIRAPSASNPASDTPTFSFSPPAIDFLQGTWHVTHSTLPMWKSNKNVRITYSPLPNSPDKLDDLVEYQSLTGAGSKTKSVRGIDTPNQRVPGSYDWRGKGWLMVASSHWEVLGYGAEEGGWIVTYFAKSMFTPAGIDVYSRQKGGLSAELMSKIKLEMRGIEDATIKTMVKGMFSIQHD
jgi:hypothetical protein